MITDRRHFVLLLSVLLLSGFLITSWLSYRVAHDSLSEQIAESTLPLTSDNIYSEIQQDLLRPIFISSLMAQDTFVRSWILDGEQDSDAMVHYLREIQDRYDAVSSFFVSERTRRYYHPHGVLKQISEQDPQDRWYFHARDLSGGQEYEVNIDRDTANLESMVVFVNYLVYDFNHNLLGVTGVGLALERVQQLIEVYQQRYNRLVYFVNRQGEVTLYGSGFSGPTSLHQRPGVSRLATGILTTPSGSYSFERDGETVYLNSRLVPEFQWYLMVEQASDPSEQRLLQTLLGNLLLSVGVTLVVLLLAYLTLGGYQRRLEQMATTDKLTGVANRQAFEIVYEKAVHSAQRRRSPLSLIMLDIDHFKSINDTYGHLLGDRVIAAVATAARDPLRSTDTLCRWGGEEFLILLPDCQRDDAERIAELIRQQIAGRRFGTGRTQLPVTVSCGVAQFDGTESALSLLNRVDDALYQAKANGRDRVELA